MGGTDSASHRSNSAWEGDDNRILSKRDEPNKANRNVVLTYTHKLLSSGFASQGENSGQGQAEIASRPNPRLVSLCPASAHESTARRSHKTHRRTRHSRPFEGLQWHYPYRESITAKLS